MITHVSKEANLWTGDLVVHLFQNALRQHPEQHTRWNLASLQLGGMKSKTVIAIEIQYCRDLDLLIRTLEAEFELRSESNNMPNAELDPYHWQSMLSDIWIGQMYAIMFALNFGKSEKIAFNKIFKDFEYVRVGIEKHQIPKDTKLKQPLEMEALGDGPKLNFLYDGKNNKETIIPTGLSSRKSKMWQVIDHSSTSAAYWVERLELSERFLKLSSPS